MADFTAVVLYVAANSADLTFGAAGCPVVVMTPLCTVTIFQRGESYLISTDLTFYIVTTGTASVLCECGSISGGKKQEAGA
jgi:L-lactate permease